MADNNQAGGLAEATSPDNLSLETVYDIPVQITVVLGRTSMQVNQLLKLVGVCDSGGAGKHLVDTGAVRVDGAGHRADELGPLGERHVPEGGPARVAREREEFR